MFVVSDLPCHDHFTSHRFQLGIYSCHSWHMLTRIPLHMEGRVSGGGTMASVFIVQVFPFSVTLYHFLFQHKRALSRRGPPICAILSVSSRAPLWNLSVDDITEHIYSSKLDSPARPPPSFFLYQAWEIWNAEIVSAERWSPAGGSGDCQVFPDRLPPTADRTGCYQGHEDVVFINYRLSRCTYYIRGGIRK